jgi:hypothetical protein
LTRGVTKVPSLSQDMMLKLLESDETKNYASNAVKHAVPMLVQAGLGYAVPFLSPLIIAASSGLLLKGLKLAGDKIDIAYDKLQPYQEQGGTKGFVAKMASPCLTVAKKVLPVGEKTLYEALGDDGSKIQQMFKIILNDQNKRKEFEDKLQKFLTGDYGSSKEFQNAVKETLGIKADRLALEAYTQFTGIIYDKDILNKIILLSEDQTQIKKSIKESVEKLQNSYEVNYKAFKEQIIKLRDQFYESHGLYRLVPNYFEEEDYDVNKDMNDWKMAQASLLFIQLNKARNLEGMKL